mgnify:FL=1|jgi:hypothetical protein|tara:strand:- start:56 stop:475 length:420 start_codon:yes stop_codon:yes gene_type:complete
MNEEAFKKLHKNICLNASRPSPTRKSGTPDYKIKEVNVTVKELMDIFYGKQEKKCYWFGVELNPDWIFTPKHPMAISVDRFEYNYDRDTVVICSRFANLGRNTCPDDLFSGTMHFLKNKWGWDEYLNVPPMQKELFSYD